MMTFIFRDAIGRYVHTYLDDIFVFSDTLEEHVKHIRDVLDRLRKHHFFLRAAKCELFSATVDCLGHSIDDKGIHADTDKMERIREWRTPRTFNDVQRFLGLVQYIAPYMPDVAQFTGPLSIMTRNNVPFVWMPVHETCFQHIKRLAAKAPILKPINTNKEEPIWVICDASVSGVGCMYGQGPTWQFCRPAGFMSRKFTAAQHNYRVFEIETLAILEALLKWEDKLLGYRIHVVTDHKALEFFLTQRKLSSRQARWMEYLSRFDFDIRYIKGINNKVADALSRYYESDAIHEYHEPHEYVNADIRIDKNLDDLPQGRIEELAREHLANIELRRSSRLRGKQTAQHPISEPVERRDEEAAEMQANAEIPVPQVPVITSNEEDITVFQSRPRGVEPLTILPERDEFIEEVKRLYTDDPLFCKVLSNPEHHKPFSVENGLIYTKNRGGEIVLCIPSGRAANGKSLRGIIAEQAHEVIGHFGGQRTADYVRRWYWWPRVNGNIEEFCKSCETCQQVKTSNRKPVGLLHSLPIPTRPWESIGMDFIGPFPESQGYDYLWVVICRMTSRVHLIPVKTTITASQLSWIFVKEIVKLHGLPKSIVSDRDSKFTSRWWREVHHLLGAKLLMSTSFHPQTDGITERVNRSIGQILRSMVKADQKDWVEKCPMMEFALNSSINESTGYAPFELDGGYMPSMVREYPSDAKVSPGVREFADRALQHLSDAHDSLIEARVKQTFHANKHRRDEPEIKLNDLVYLSTKNLNLPRGRATKLLPKFLGPYPVTEVHPDSSNYRIGLPTELAKRGIHNNFHASLIRKHHPNDDALFPMRSVAEPYDFGEPSTVEWLVDEIIGHHWDGRKILFHIKWNLGDTTTEPYTTCKDLVALDRYLELQGVDDWRRLPRTTG
jgi:hypothetical protein